jgi:threonine dehydrogenase-like Zn-dependent dehydrogenase
VAWGATPHDGEPADVAIVCTPRADAILAAADALGPGGRLCLYAPPAPGSPLGIDGNAIFMRELEMSSSWSAGPADMRAALELLRAGTVAPLGMVQLRVPLEETGRALRAQKSGEALKAVVLP